MESIYVCIGWAIVSEISLAGSYLYLVFPSLSIEPGGRVRNELLFSLLLFPELFIFFDGGGYSAGHAFFFALFFIRLLCDTLPNFFRVGFPEIGEGGFWSGGGGISELGGGGYLHYCF